MFDLSKPKQIPLDQQTPAQKMEVLRVVAESMLGPKWDFYKKIKKEDQGFQLIKETDLTEQMKATRSALKFTSKNTCKAYLMTYKATLAELKTKGGLKNVPSVPDTAEGADTPRLTPEQDAFMIQWAPLKFLINLKLIRDKGTATERYAEGLVAKLMFKVAGYYATPEHWDVEKLGFYLRKVTPESSFADIANALDPLKKDLLKLVEVYQPFKFGKASLSKDVASEADSFDDASDTESEESKIKTLYLYHLIYEGMENFLYGYYARLCFLTSNKKAVQYLTSIFEPAMQKAIENKQIFLGSFELDRSKRVLAKGYQAYQAKMEEGPAKMLITIDHDQFHSWKYTLTYLRAGSLQYQLTEVPAVDSNWALFFEEYLVGLPKPKPPRPLTEDENPDSWERPMLTMESRLWALTQILNLTLISIKANDIAKKRLLERFKVIIQADRERVKARVDEIRKKAEKKIRELEKKAKQVQRMKQEDAYALWQKDIQRFKAGVAHHIKEVVDAAQADFIQQKSRIKQHFAQLASNSKNSTGGVSPLVELAATFKSEGEFYQEYTAFVLKDLSEGFYEELKPFYNHLDEILKPDVQTKILLNQALLKHGFQAECLSLSEDEVLELQRQKEHAKKHLAELKPDLWESKLVMMATLIPVEDLLKMSLDSKSLFTLLQLKVTSPQNPKAANLPNELVKAFIELNKQINPIPANRIILPGRDSQPDPVKKINQPLLNKLMVEVHGQA